MSLLSMLLEELISGTQRDCVVEACSEALWSAVLGESLARPNSRHWEAIVKTSQEDQIITGWISSNGARRTQEALARPAVSPRSKAQKYAGCMSEWQNTLSAVIVKSELAPA
ncbi:MAG: hypothetical protein Q9171_006612 [Xanthocarpia ochracea]